MGYAIRQYVHDTDLDAVTDLWRRSAPGVRLSRSDSPDELRKKAEFAPDLFLVAETSDGIIGTVIGGFDGRRGLIYHLAVENGQRGQGIGSALMAELESRLRTRGCLKSYLLVTMDNPAALEFYRRRGWSEMDIHLMGKELQ